MTKPLARVAGEVGADIVAGRQLDVLSALQS